MIVPPYLGYGEIGKRAKEFLDRYHSSQELPVPIEKIVEFQLGLDIVPLPNLFSVYRVSGFLTADRSTVIVDERQFNRYWEKYRFTLAHEVGHHVLHGDCYEEADWSDADEYRDYILNMDKEALSRYEVQGNYFAEQVLVPEEHLIEIAREIVGRHRDELVKIDASNGILLPYISNEIARPFEVSPKVIECRFNHMDDEKNILEL